MGHISFWVLLQVSDAELVWPHIRASYGFFAVTQCSAASVTVWHWAHRRPICAGNLFHLCGALQTRMRSSSCAVLQDRKTSARGTEARLPPALAWIGQRVTSPKVPRARGAEHCATTAIASGTPCHQTDVMRARQVRASTGVSTAARTSLVAAACLERICRTF